MIPVMMRFWMPHKESEPPVGEDWDCDDQSLVCDFLTDGAIDGEEPEIFPGTSFYESGSAVASGGLVSPATFNVVMDSDPAVTSSSVFQVHVASGENVYLEFRTVSATDDSGTRFCYDLNLGAGEECTFSFEVYSGGIPVDVISDTFSIGAVAGMFAIYTEFGESALNMFLPPDAGSPTATLSGTFLTSYNIFSIVVTSSGSNSAVDYIQCCGTAGVSPGA